MNIGIANVPHICVSTVLKKLQKECIYGQRLSQINTSLLSSKFSFLKKRRLGTFEKRKIIIQFQQKHIKKKIRNKPLHLESWEKGYLLKGGRLTDNTEIKNYFSFFL